MSDASTTQPQARETEMASTGHGRHRGPISTQDGESAPRGRHRRPVEQAESAA
ncbi:hypothetical protein ACF1AX_07960 [Streptomyces sp. NPDC014802]|jgi:hypothetical protein|uniref:hypothetical protein n=1 Tax=unclassified Streptomyces TaxID=2593676 RepID=UPI0036AF43A8